jgi:enoyl-[acyl-carrier protein] reductase I
MTPTDPKDLDHPTPGAVAHEPRPSYGGLMRGKRAVITGVANDRSIAWAIAQTFRAEGAELVFTYPGSAMERRVRPLAESLDAKAIIDCDVAKDEDIDRCVAEVKAVWDRVDVLVHSIGYAPKEALAGRFAEVTSREVWRIAMDVSAYSLIGLVRAFRPLMVAGSNVVSLSYYGAEKVVRNYNVMGVCKAALECSTRYLADDLGQDGIRVNCISAGPLKTLAAAGIKGMREMLTENADRTPLRRNIEQEDCARAALYLCSDLGKNVTGEILHVDAGQNIVGVVSMG